MRFDVEPGQSRLAAAGDFLYAGQQFDVGRQRGGYVRHVDRRRGVAQERESFVVARQVEAQLLCLGNALGDEGAPMLTTAVAPRNAPFTPSLV